MKVATGPFKGPSIFILGTPDNGSAPTCESAGLAPGFTAHAEPNVPATACPTCDCSPAFCAMPEEMHASAATCADANAAIQTPFDSPPGWEGTCTDASAIPGGLECGGGPCVESVTISAPKAAPCKPLSTGNANIPAVEWGVTARQCLLGDLGAGGCGAGEGCAPPVPANATLCVWAEGAHTCKDPAYPRQITVYQSLQDDRTCSPCACGEPGGADCAALVSVYTDGGCATLLGTYTLTSTMDAACFDLPPGTGLGSKGAFFKVEVPGACAPSGGEPSGSIQLGGMRTLCCQRELPAPV